MGQIGFANGVRAFVEFGKLSASYADQAHFWVDDRLTAYGTRGYVWCDPDGRWGTFNSRTHGEILSGEGDNWQLQELNRVQGLFARELADCLDDTTRQHSCNIDITYHGYEIMEAICLSALDNKRVDLPLGAIKRQDIFERMRQELPDCHELA
jgi:hypothetical protein